MILNGKYNKLRIPGNLTTKFGGRTRGESFHPGIDVANAEGTPIPAFADGVITGVGVDNTGFGNVVKLKDAGGNLHQYGHIKKALVKTGDQVEKGQSIAKMGSEGNSYSPSGGDPTHTDIRIVNAYNRYINPMKFL